MGTSSWADPGFVKHWYPKGLAARDRLRFYAERFEVVELNSSFYATPPRDNVERWSEITPAGFRFHVKLHRLLSWHATKPDALPPDMREGLELNSRGNVVRSEELQREMVKRMAESMQPLDESGRLGAYLLQLSPAFRPRDCELTALDPILDGFSPHPVAVEFRYRAWMKDKRRKDVFSYLADHDTVYVSVDAPLTDHVPIMPPIDAVTNRRLAYLRAHGRNARGYMSGRTVAERFDYDYSDAELEEIAERARTLADDADEAHVLFNNNARELAPKAARRMRQLLGQDPGPEP